MQLVNDIMEKKLSKTDCVLEYMNLPHIRSRLLRFLCESQKISRQMYENVCQRTCIIQNGSLHFSVDDIQKWEMKSLGKGPFILSSKDMEKNQNHHPHHLYQNIGNGLFASVKTLQKIKDSQNSYLVDVQTTPTFSVFHASCLPGNCNVAHFLHPFPADLCSLLKKEMMDKNSDGSQPVRVLVTFSEKEAKTMVITRSKEQIQYGMLFSHLMIQFDSLYTKEEDKEKDHQQNLVIRLLTDFEQIVEPCVLLSEIEKKLAKTRQPEKQTTMQEIWVCIFPSTSSSTSCTSSNQNKIGGNFFQIVKRLQKSPIVLIELSQEFEDFYQKRIQTN